MPGAANAPGGGEEEGRRGSGRIRYSHLITAGRREINDVGSRGQGDMRSSVCGENTEGGG